MIKTHSFTPAKRHKPPVKTDAEGNRIGISTERTGMYDHRWRQARAIFLRRNPLCSACAKDGKITAANEVDHIIPHRGDMKLFWDKSNLAALCKPCHSKKTAGEVNARKRDR